MVPVVAALLGTHPSVDAIDLSTLEVVVVGAAPCSPTILNQCYERLKSKTKPRFSVCQAFGMTETSELAILFVRSRGGGYEGTIDGDLTPTLFFIVCSDCRVCSVYRFNCANRSTP